MRGGESPRDGSKNDYFLKEMIKEIVQQLRLKKQISTTRVKKKKKKPSYLYGEMYLLMLTQLSTKFGSSCSLREDTVITESFSHPFLRMA